MFGGTPNLEKPFGSNIVFTICLSLMMMYQNFHVFSVKKLKKYNILIHNTRITLKPCNITINIHSQRNRICSCELIAHRFTRQENGYRNLYTIVWMTHYTRLGIRSIKYSPSSLKAAVLLPL